MIKKSWYQWWDVASQCFHPDMPSFVDHLPKVLFPMAAKINTTLSYVNFHSVTTHPDKWSPFHCCLCYVRSTYSGPIQQSLVFLASFLPFMFNICSTILELCRIGYDPKSFYTFHIILWLSPPKNVFFKPKILGFRDELNFLSDRQITKRDSHEFLQFNWKRKSTHFF